jgi:hypothetical protein
MLNKINISKLALVIFLTILIWVWADLALDETHPIYNARIVIGQTKSNLWVSFPQGSSIDVNEIILKGAASQINNIDQIITNDPRKLEFPLIIKQFDIDKPGQYPVDVKEIIKQSNWITALGLSVEGCDPNTVQVNVVALTQKPVEIQYFDKNGLPLNLETPQQVTMSVPSDWRNPARVVLSDEEINRATKQPIRVKPYIDLPNGEKIEAEKMVEIRLPPQQTLLDKKKVANVSVGICFSENLSKGQYKVDIGNMPDIVNFDIYTTPDAQDAYEDQKYQVMLEIVDDDITTTSKEGIVRRPVYYLFPEDYVKQNKIKLAQEKVTATFKVTPLVPAEKP